jgi:hypothetical protein
MFQVRAVTAIALRAAGAAGVRRGRVCVCACVCVDISWSWADACWRACMRASHGGAQLTVVEQRPSPYDCRGGSHDGAVAAVAALDAEDASGAEAGDRGRCSV